MCQYSICNIHFGIMKSELILGISVRIVYVLAINYSSSIRLGVRSRCLPIKEEFNQNWANVLQEVSIIVRVNFEVTSVIFWTIFLSSRSITCLSCPLGSWVSLWNFETIRGSLMKPKWQKLASLAQNICKLWFQFFSAVFASKGYPFKNIFQWIPRFW